MGIGGSTWEGYEAQLGADTVGQSHSVLGSEEEGTTPIIRHPSAPEGFAGCLVDDEKNELNTGWALFEFASKKYATTNYFGTRTFPNANNPKERGEYQWITYADVYETVLQVGNGFRSLELPEQANIGIFSSNRAEWMFAHFGNLSQSYRTVALYETLGANAVAYIITHAQLPVIVVEKSKLSALFDAIDDIQNNNSQDDPLLLRFIIQIDVDDRFGNNHETVDDADRERAKSFNIDLIGLSELRSRCGDKLDIVAPQPDDLAYIMYTSGTTGKPKGVMLSHVGFAANVASISRLVPFAPDDRHVSYLPMAHIFETMAITTFTFAGAEVGFFQGDIRKLGQDFIDLRPTNLIGVPRVFSKTYDKFKLKVSQEGSIKQYLVGMAESYSQTAIRDNGGRSPTFDSLVWSKISASIGFDRIKVVVSGAAPLSPYLAEFMRIVCPGAVVLQGYAMTETTAGGTVVNMGDWTLGHVGVPTDNMELRLVDAPECNYRTSDTPLPRGEVQFRGIPVMKGYFRNEEATRKTLSEDGWLSTGDIGRLNANGTLSIIDRRKNMFKTSQGEYVASEKLETVYGKANMVNQIWIYGNSYKSFVVGMVVPDALVLVDYFKEQGWWPADASSLGPPTSPEWNAKFAEVGGADEAQLKPMILENVKQYDNKLKRFEQVKDIAIEWELDDLLQGFTVANDCQTPTQKLRRPQLLNRYAETLKQMYTDNGEPPAEHETWGN